MLLFGQEFNFFFLIVQKVRQTSCAAPKQVVNRTLRGIVMKICMISNYINHHQIPFSEAIYEKIGTDYTFIQTKPMEEERINMGWGVDVAAIPYVKLLYKEEATCRELIDSCDILLVGWTEREDIIKNRLEQNKLTIRISERLYREGQYKAISPKGLIRKYNDHTKYRNSNVYLLCAGAYVASDFHLVHAYPEKMYRFGYFPETRVYKTDTLFQKKPDLNVIQIVWAGRFMKLKHPEFVVKLAKDLKEKDYLFHIHMIGSGEMEDEIKEAIKQNELQEEISLYGFMKPNEVRDIMEKCHIHLFTSNHLEGWGAVVNEGMNSGLAEVVNSEVGCVPFLIKHEKNGLVYRDGKYENFLACVMKLMENKGLITEYGKAAYYTIVKQWNEKNAVEQLFRFYENFQKGKIDPPQSGPFSVAPVISPRNMYRAMIEHKI